MSQRNEILKALQQGDRLTAIDALNRFGCFRLSARIGELIEDGLPIESRMVTLDNGKSVAEYRLETGQLSLGG